MKFALPLLKDHVRDGYWIFAILFNSMQVLLIIMGTVCGYFCISIEFSIVSIDLATQKSINFENKWTTSKISCLHTHAFTVDTCTDSCIIFYPCVSSLSRRSLSVPGAVGWGRVLAPFDFPVLFG